MLKRFFILLFAFSLIYTSLTFGQEYSHASSLWLSYQVPNNDAADIIMIDFQVDSAALYTYYAALCWNNGYAGVQRAGSGFYKHVHFSLWDPEGDTSKVIWHDWDVHVQRFGGEGTGWKSMWGFRWKEHHPYRLLVKSKVVNSKTHYDAWFFNFDRDAWKHLATFEYPLVSQLDYITSFLEDWAGTPDKYRSYELFNVRLRKAGTFKWYQLSKAKYTVNGDNPNCDGRIVNNHFFLETGGTITPTNASGTVLEIPSATFSPKALRIQSIRAENTEQGVKVTWTFRYHIWAPQETYRLRIDTSKTFSAPLFDSKTVTSSDTTAEIDGWQPDSNQTYYLRLDCKSVFDFSDSKIDSFKNGAWTSVRANRFPVPDHFELNQNFPNPFNPQTTIEYVLKERSLVQLKIFDSTGKIIDQSSPKWQAPGRHYYLFKPSFDVASGIYFYRLTVGNRRYKQSKIRKMIFLK